MKTLIKVIVAAGAMYVLAGCSGGSDSNNSNPYYSAYGYGGYGSYGSTACAPEAVPTGSCQPGVGLGWSNELHTCLQIAPCQGASAEPGAIPGCIYGYAPGNPPTQACMPVHPF